MRARRLGGLGLAGALAFSPAWASPVAGALAAHDWSRARTLAAVQPDPLALKLVDFMRLHVAGAASLTDLSGFIAANPAWPDQAVLHRNLAQAIADEPDDAAAIAACEHFHPEQDSALLRCAEAARDAKPAAGASKAAEAANWARLAWRVGIDRPAAEAAFLARWAAMLRPQDEWARFEALGCDAESQPERQIARLDADHQALARARLAFCRGDAAAETLLPAIPPALRDDPNLFLGHARWCRARGDLAEAVALWRAGGTLAESHAPAARRLAFWQERDRLARLLLAGNALSNPPVPAAAKVDANSPQGATAGAAQNAAQSASQDAYFLADDTQLGPDQAPDALFLAGWIASRKLQDRVGAVAKFQALQAVSPSLITQGRAHFWLAEAAATPAEAQRELAAAASYPTTFYGQLAAQRLQAQGQPGFALPTLLAGLRDPLATQPMADQFNTAELTRAANIFAAWGMAPQARAFLLREMRAGTGAPWFALTAAAGNRLSLPDVAVIAARLAGRDGFTFLHAGWPIPPELQGADALTLAIARQESNFDPAIVSPSGAQGLMQLMPATAADLQRQLGQGAAPPNLFDARENIALGTAYLGKLLAQFGGVRPYAIAAYNAGPRHGREWLTQNGDPAKQTGPAAMLDWIEQIPFAETRNYVQRVMENAAIYAALPK